MWQVVDLEEAVALLREKLQSKTFRKAVGGKVAEAIEVLLSRYECGACLGEREAADLLNNYYVFKYRVKRLLELYDKLSRGGLSAVVAQVLGEEIPLEPVDYSALLKELEAYGAYVSGLAARVTACARRYSSTSSNA